MKFVDHLKYLNAQHKLLESLDKIGEYILKLQRENKILRQRLFLCKRDNRNNRNKLKYQIQQLQSQKYYFTDEQVWDLNITLAKIILNGLKKFKKINQYSCPMVFNSIEDWHNVIDKMIWSFEQVAKDEINCDRQYHESIQEGLELFAKYFTSLWD